MDTGEVGILFQNLDDWRYQVQETSLEVDILGKDFENSHRLPRLTLLYVLLLCVLELLLLQQFAEKLLQQQLLSQEYHF